MSSQLGLLPQTVDSSHSSVTQGKKRTFLPLWTKLSVPIVVMTALVGWGTYHGLLRISKSNLLESKVAAAEMVIKLFAASVTPAVVFGDETEMQRSVADLSRNFEVTDVELWLTGNGQEPPPIKPSAEFHRTLGKLERPSALQSQKKVFESYLEVVEPIVDNEKKVSAVAIARFSLAREQAVLAVLARRTLVASAGVGLGLTLALILALARIVVVPLSRLKTAAKNLQDGKASNQRVLPKGNFEDELGQLGTVFVAMADAVADREARIEKRNKELRLILDNVSQGFVTLTVDGKFQTERSAIVSRWLPELGEGANFSELIGLLDPKQQQMAELGWSQLNDGFLPMDLCLDQLPKRASHAGQHFAFEYEPVIDGEVLSRVVLVITDITEQVERQRAEEDQKEFAALVDHLVRDRGGFLEFWGELERLMNRLLGTEKNPSMRRDLHTVKGNSRFFGMWRLSMCCHRIEDTLHERAGEELLDEERAALHGEWSAIQQRVATLTKGASAFLELSETDYAALSHGLRERFSHEVLAELISEFRYEPTLRRLERAKESIQNTCRRTGKPAATVTIEDNGVRLPPERWATFWAAFVHLLTNAVEHGLEPAEARSAAGKPAEGKVKLSTKIADKKFLIEVSDDGRGVDWKAVEAKASAKGMLHRTRGELERALLSEGFTTKEEANEVAGRGVGLSAVTHAVHSLGGTIKLSSEAGKGTTWSLTFPDSVTHVPPRESLLPRSNSMTA